MAESKRRWIPEGGLQKYRERIHKESKYADTHKNLPFTFSKPQRTKKSSDFMCGECGRIFSAPKNTIMYVCPDCKKVTKVEKLNGE